MAALLVPELGPRIVGEGFDELSTLTRVVVSLVKPPNEFTARDKDNLSARVFIWASYFLVILSRIRRSFYLVMGRYMGPDTTTHAHNEIFRIRSLWVDHIDRRFLVPNFGRDTFQILPVWTCRCLLIWLAVSGGFGRSNLLLSRRNDFDRDSLFDSLVYLESELGRNII